jgi:hypothetical protein
MYLENTQPNILFVGCLSYDIQLHGFSDSDWVGSVVDIRSATWICFYLSFAMISWASRKQNFVSLSNAEAKFIAAYDSCMEAVWPYKLVSILSD